MVLIEPWPDAFAAPIYFTDTHTHRHELARMETTKKAAEAATVKAQMDYFAIFEKYESKAVSASRSNGTGGEEAVAAMAWHLVQGYGTRGGGLVAGSEDGVR